MGLTASSTGRYSDDGDLIIERRENDSVIALAGNPNVGKSTVFNFLTGMNQHTGNWTGKTVQNAQGRFERDGKDYILVDIPGTYSILAHSAEEEAARDFICFGGADGAVVVCDATCLERNLNLVIQIIEITPHVIVCVNLLDEARKKRISVDTARLSELLGVPVFGVTARTGEGIDEMTAALGSIGEKKREDVIKCPYPDEIEAAVSRLSAVLSDKLKGAADERFAALRLLDGDNKLIEGISKASGTDIAADEAVQTLLEEEKKNLAERGFDETRVKDEIINAVVRCAERTAAECVSFEKPDYYERDRKIDRILTHRFWGVPIMAAMLALVFWITVTGANYPSALLSRLFGALGEKLHGGLAALNAPSWLDSMLVDGIYRVLSWVTAVMLPPMAIFFPLFTLMEDLGYLPRVAFNLDRYFKKAGVCGKQSLTMAMGFGCNAAGITGCRIIDSPRERLIAILTNNFVPCNGRFPSLIAIITIFFAGSGSGSSVIAVLILTAVIIFGVMLTLGVSKLLSKTVLKGIPSSFTLELPPYRRPQIGQILVRSVFDRTIFVLGRAVSVAAPAGLFIWLLANIKVGDGSVLSVCSGFLDPFASVFGLDGTILLAFILGFPANEIVIPIMLMTYMAQGSLVEYESLESLKDILVSNGWTAMTAVCTLIFILCHFPCSTSMLTIKKETGSLKWTALAFVLPTVTGLALCFIAASGFRLAEFLGA
ncbi:MAG: ferrous iron transport protein B [Oscillospiraceae bacterium]|nr:ferrous iron transport protein B [Oscillospiraceae bacterium]